MVLGENCKSSATDFNPDEEPSSVYRLGIRASQNVFSCAVSNVGFSFDAYRGVSVVGADLIVVYLLLGLNGNEISF
jgi:hypothetical protein